MSNTRKQKKDFSKEMNNYDKDKWKCYKRKNPISKGRIHPMDLIDQTQQGGGGGVGGVHRHRERLVKHIETEALKEHSRPTGRYEK